MVTQLMCAPSGLALSMAAQSSPAPQRLQRMQMSAKGYIKTKSYRDDCVLQPPNDLHYMLTHERKLYEGNNFSHFLFI